MGKSQDAESAERTAGRTIVNPDCFGEQSEEKMVALA
jgi:hypothetical protein